MSEVSVVMQMYQSLSPEEKAAFLRMLGLPPELTEIIDSETIEAFLAKHRFPHGEVCCVHCGNIDVKKNGRTRSGHQRFYCKGCHQSFTYATKTIFGGAKRPVSRLPTGGTPPQVPHPGHRHPLKRGNAGCHGEGPTGCRGATCTGVQWVCPDVQWG